MNEYHELVLNLDQHFKNMFVLSAVIFYIGYQATKHKQLKNYIYLVSCLFLGSLIIV